MPPFILVLMFVGTILVPSAAYLYWVHPAWSLLYLFDPNEVPDLVLFAIVLVQSGVLVAAWYLGAYLMHNGRDRLVVYGIAGSAFALLVMGIIFAGRLGQYGTYEEFASGDTAALLDVKLGYVLITLVLGSAAAAGFVGLELVRNARRAHAR